MDLQGKTYADVLVLAPSGRIDHTTADAFRSALMPFIEDSGETSKKIAVNLRDVEYISSVGLRVLMLAAKGCKKLERTIVVAELQPTMREIFEISRFNLVFDTYDTVRDALEALSPAALTAFDGG